MILEKRKLFIITTKKSYRYIMNNLNQLVDLDIYDIILPYQIDKHYFLDQMIYENSFRFLPQSDAYVNKIIAKLPIEQQQEIKNDDIKRYIANKQYEFSTKHWLKEKLDYSKTFINQADICMIIHDSTEDSKLHLNELTKEAKIAVGRNKEIIHKNIPNLEIEKVRSKKHAA